MVTFDSDPGALRKVHAGLCEWHWLIQSWGRNEETPSLKIIVYVLAIAVGRTDNCKISIMIGTRHCTDWSQSSIQHIALLGYLSSLMRMCTLLSRNSSNPTLHTCNGEGS